MNRRRFLIRMSAALGYGALVNDAAALDAALAFFGKPSGFLGPDELEFVSQVSDIIIPQSDTPSASQAGVPAYIDFYLGEFLESKARNLFVEDLRELCDESIQGFLRLSEEHKTELIQSLDDRLGSSEENTVYKKLKELIVIGYYTSQVGATQALRYDPVPGPYKEIKLAEVGRAWL
ncbi:gluconate 2-dehydrogenase subunit 3 family protein [Microbulbifer elongatus]|uniref:Gluconate 2-dehydrogenase subunit 3 family protein n=1 Tax=Microbulbifer elongatus TaxID=86173 RepID=A0ABT1P6C0_9GAMM|nr:gluconate 2-dehydrogenase subunit 3 family protein [Microbulbifer elongatus]MCQ3831032.1 gluconate 2-dehydrogenase subunit 3 family protein [Microbulbifer elongatus]